MIGNWIEDNCCTRKIWLSFCTCFERSYSWTLLGRLLFFFLYSFTLEGLCSSTKVSLSDRQPNSYSWCFHNPPEAVLVCSLSCLFHWCPLHPLLPKKPDHCSLMSVCCCCCCYSSSSLWGISLVCRYKRYTRVFLIWPPGSLVPCQFRLYKCVSNNENL